MTTAARNSSARGCVPLAIADREALYGAYMPQFRGGGLFMPTAEKYALGDAVAIRLSLMDEGASLPLAGKVVWITPAGAQGNRAAGIGVQFDASPESDLARARIEALLGDMPHGDRPTCTM